MPRGSIHQAEALETEHSLHVTVSVNQVRAAMPDVFVVGAAGLHFEGRPPPFP